VATGLRGIATLLALLYENCLLRFVSRSQKYAILLLPVFEHFKMILAQQQTVICLFLLHRFKVRSLRQRWLADEHHVTKFICNTVIRSSTAYNTTVYETSSERCRDTERCREKPVRTSQKRGFVTCRPCSTLTANKLRVTGHMKMLCFCVWKLTPWIISQLINLANVQSQMARWAFKEYTEFENFFKGLKFAFQWTWDIFAVNATTLRHTQVLPQADASSLFCIFICVISKNQRDLTLPCFTCMYRKCEYICQSVRSLSQCAWNDLNQLPMHARDIFLIRFLRKNVQHWCKPNIFYDFPPNTCHSIDTTTGLMCQGENALKAPLTKIVS